MNIDKPDTNIARANVADRSIESQAKTAPGAVPGNAQNARPAAEAQAPTFSSGVQALIESSRSESAPTVDQQRVEQIRQAIADGTYHVDPNRLAQHFLELETVLDQ